MAPQTVTFNSRFTQHVLVRQPKIEVALLSGGHHTHQQRTEYKFIPGLDAESGKLVGQLTVRKGQDKLVDHNGWLKPGENEDLERDAVDALMAHREYGQEFWIQGFSPGTLLPRPKEWRQAVTKATAALDDEKLAGMIAEETRTHARPDLLREAQEALDIVTQTVAEAQAEQEPQPAAKGKPKAPAAA